MLLLTGARLAVAGEADAPVLTLEAAIRQARGAQPQLARARAAIASAEARVDVVGARRFPQLNGSAGVSLGSTAGGFGIGQQTLTPGGVAAQYSLGIAGSQLVWDFGKLGTQVAAAETTVRAQRASLASVEQSVVYGVRTAFFEAQAKQALVGVAKENFGIQERLVRQAEAGVAAGLRPEIDLAQLRSQRANANVALVRAEVDLEVARATLNRAMGVETTSNFAVSAEPASPLEGEDRALDALVEEALSNRPEFLAFRMQLEAQESTLAAARLGTMPAIGANANANHLGNTTAIGGLNWSTGLSLSWPLLQGGVVEGQVAEAEAAIATLRAQVLEQRLVVRLDVERAQRTVVVGRRVVEASKVALDAAREQLRLADGRYAAGVGNVLELGNAQANLVTAGLQQVSAEQELAQARALLGLALGRP